MKKKLVLFLPSIIFFVLFLFMLVGALFIDVSNKGVEGSNIGFSLLNLWFYRVLGEANNLLYLISELLAYVLIVFTGLFFLSIAVNSIKNKTLKNITKEKIALFVIFVVMAIFYILFEIIPVNYRPVVLDEGLENSFPSSHTLLSVTVSVAFAIYFIECKNLTENKKFFLVFALLLIGVLVVFTRLLSGVHWLTDIIAGLFLGLSLSFTMIPVEKITK